MSLNENKSIADEIKKNIKIINAESKKEIIRINDDEEWTGKYIFENEWQSFRTKSDRKLLLKSTPYPIKKGKTKIAIKVVDIFGNDTMKIIEVNNGGK